MHAVQYTASDIKIEVLDYLLKYDVNINSQDIQGDTPIIKATKNNDSELVKWLIKTGSDATLRDRNGDMPVHIARNLELNDLLDSVLNSVNECLYRPCNVTLSNCINSESGYYCDCKNGYFNPFELSLDGNDCYDINECETLSIINYDKPNNREDICSQKTNGTAVCTNLPGKYKCDCIEGYTGTGETCYDINECALSDFVPCQDKYAICSNTPGSYSCPCRMGFAGDGLYAEGCVDIDECNMGASPCDLNATCENTLGSFSCTCHEGYEGNGFACQDIDECNFRPCVGKLAKCINTVGSFDCECSTGFTGDGRIESFSSNLVIPLGELNVPIETIPSQEESEILYQGCIGKWNSWSSFMPSVCPCDSMKQEHKRTCSVGTNLCDNRYCHSYNNNTNTCYETVNCNTNPCPPPTMIETRKRTTFFIEDLNLEDYCNILDELKSKMAGSTAKKFNFVAGDFVPTDCDGE